MINRVEMIPAIVTACPDFASAYDALVHEWKDEVEAPLYLALSDFSQYVIGLLENGDRLQLHAAFEVIERFHVDGDPFVREAATIGILETLQNTDLHRHTKPDPFLDFLRPESLRYWQKVQDFWENGTIVTDD